MDMGYTADILEDNNGWASAAESGDRNRLVQVLGLVLAPSTAEAEAGNRASSNALGGIPWLGGVWSRVFDEWDRSSKVQVLESNSEPIPQRKDVGNGLK